MVTDLLKCYLIERKFVDVTSRLFGSSGCGYYTYGGVELFGVFPLFLKKLADIIAPKLSIIFRRLIRLGSFPVCWRSANVTAIPKGAPSPDKENYRPISITPIQSKETYISGHLCVASLLFCICSPNP